MYILTSKCASRHNGVHFFDISTAKSGPELVCFVHFDFQMCFAPQRRALFRHLNFQKWSETWCVLYILTWKCASRHNGALFRHCNFQKWSDAEVFCTFSLGNMLHNGVHFFDISTSKSGPRAACVLYTFDLQMCFAPQRRAIFHLSSGQLAPHPPL